MRSAAAELVPHPASRCDAVRAVAARIAAAGDRGWRLHFRVDGTMSGLRWPDRGQAERVDGLWQHSCFEAFLRAADSDSYHEFNFASSGAWAVYRFAGRRSGRECPELPTPAIEVERGPEFLEMSVGLPPAALSGLARTATVHAGLAAVIEDAAGRLSYWALAHHSPQPDFHDPAGFTIALPAR
ncbi:MAG: DOMON-like domain-containing protein [Gammaproteobacteria bacterium]